MDGEDELLVEMKEKESIGELQSGTLDPSEYIHPMDFVRERFPTTGRLTARSDSRAGTKTLMVLDGGDKVLGAIYIVLNDPTVVYVCAEPQGPEEVENAALWNLVFNYRQAPAALPEIPRPQNPADNETSGLVYLLGFVLGPLVLFLLCMDCGLEDYPNRRLALLQGGGVWCVFSLLGIIVSLIAPIK
jgi:hypothetical protein